MGMTRASETRGARDERDETMTACETMTVAQEILSQLGGGRFVVMTGAKCIAGTANGLRFKLPARFAKDGINFVSITLTANDDYSIEYGKLWGMKYRVITTQEDVYADTLRASFTEATGLDCTL